MDRGDEFVTLNDTNKSCLKPKKGHDNVQPKFKCTSQIYDYNMDVNSLFIMLSSPSFLNHSQLTKRIKQEKFS